jgi:hypothetical protein
VIPAQIFGAHGYSYTIWFDNTKFTVQATSHKDYLDHLIDVSRGSIARIVLHAPQSSQDGSQITFHLKKSSKYQCYLNGQEIRLEHIRIFGNPGLTVDFRKEFLGCYDEVEIVDESKSVTASQGDAAVEEYNLDVETSRDKADRESGLSQSFITKSPIVLNAAHGNMVPEEYQAGMGRVNEESIDIGNGYQTYNSQPIIVHQDENLSEEAMKTPSGMPGEGPILQRDKLSSDHEVAENVGSNIAANSDANDDLYDATPPRSSTQTKQTGSQQSSTSLFDDVGENNLSNMTTREMFSNTKAAKPRATKTPVVKASRPPERIATMKTSSSQPAVANKVIKSKAKIPISLDRKKQIAKEMSKKASENGSQNTTRSAAPVQNMSFELTSDPISSVDEHDASTPKLTKRPMVQSNEAAKAQALKPKKKTKAISYGKATHSRRLTPPTREKSEVSDVSVFDQLSDDSEPKTAKPSKANSKTTIKSQVRGRPKTAVKGKSRVTKENPLPKQDKETGDGSHKTRLRRNPARSSQKAQKAQDEAMGVAADEGAGEVTIVTVVKEQVIQAVEAETQSAKVRGDSNMDVTANELANVESPRFFEHTTPQQADYGDASVPITGVENTTEAEVQTMPTEIVLVEADPKSTARAVHKSNHRHTMAQKLSQRLSGVIDEPLVVERSADEKKTGSRKKGESKLTLSNVSPKAALALNLQKDQEKTVPAASTATKRTVNQSVQSNGRSSTGEASPNSMQLNGSRKRKAALSEMSPTKETRSKRQSQEAEPLRRSPRLKTNPKMEVAGPFTAKVPVSRSSRMQRPAASDQSTALLGNKTSIKIPPDATPASKPPLRRSPLLLERAQSAKKPTDSSLVDESTVRKTRMIHFDKNGPKNQGITSVPRVAQGIFHKNVNAAKRKLDPVENATIGRPLKRLNSSPAVIQLEDREEEDMPPGIASTPSEKEAKENPPLSPPKRVRSRHTSNSQGSRVTPNGSPKPADSVLRVDHIGKIFGKTLDNPEPLDDHAGRVTTQRQLRSGSTPFGPLIVLGNRAKPRLNCSGEEETRYVAHHKTKSGQYENLQSKEIIHEGGLPEDPFYEKRELDKAPENANGFHTALQNAAVKESRQTRVTQESRAEAISKNDRSRYDDERTLVREKSSSSPPSLSSDDSSEELNNEMPQSPTAELSAEEAWNVALRPHYRTFADVVHRVADVGACCLLRISLLTWLGHDYPSSGRGRYCWLICEAV